MILGYNHNIKHHGRTFHVQTEDSGPGTPMIMTHVFIGGNIIASKKQQYGELLKLDDPEAEIKLRMQGQHKEMLHNLVNGTYDEIVEKFVASGALPPIDAAPKADAPPTEIPAAAPPAGGQPASATEPPRPTTAIGIQAPTAAQKAAATAAAIARADAPRTGTSPGMPPVEKLPRRDSGVMVTPVGQAVSNDIEGLPPGAVPVTPPPIVVGTQNPKGLGAAETRHQTDKGFPKPDAAKARAPGDPR